jgi:long-chain acyl-CoA synthetase
VVAVVVPEVDTVKAWARANGVPGTLSVLCADADVKDLILADITQLGKDAGLKSFEQVELATFLGYW